MPVIIRPFRKEDGLEVRDFCADTAFMGEPLEVFLDDRELFASLAVTYYINYEPESIFLAESGGRVIGYVMGSRNEEVYRRITSGKIFPGLIFKILKNFIFSRRARVFIFHILISWARREFFRPDFSREYPAHLHINIAKGFRAQGIGALLVDRFIAYLKESGVLAVRLSSCSKNAFSFFEKFDFRLLHRQEITYFNYILKEKLIVRTYGRKLL